MRCLDLCVPSSRRADSPGEINEAERPGWMRGPRSKGRVSKNLPRFRIFSLFLVGCAAAQGNGKSRGGDLKSFRIYITCDPKIMIFHQISYAILYIIWSWDISLLFIIIDNESPLIWRYWIE